MQNNYSLYGALEYIQNIFIGPSNNLSLKAYKFERMRLGKIIVAKNGHPYGKYLYRNIYSNELIASFDKPNKDANYIYTGEDIGINTDALTYYKNT